MQSIKVIALGRLKESYLMAGCAEYLKRLGAYCRPEMIELEPIRLPDNPSEAQIQQALDKEAALILQKAGNSLLIPLCIEGKPLTSVQLAEKMAQFAGQGGSTLSFIIGSSHGLQQELKAKGALQLSLSAMTFPHQLARLMLLEQIYRAFSIHAGSPYHK